MDNNSSQVSTAIDLPVPVPNEGVFRHTACGPILRLLADNPHNTFGIRELGRAIDRPHRSVSLAVDDLESIELVSTSSERGKKLVQINHDRLTRPGDPIFRIPQKEFRDPVRTLRSELLEKLVDITGMLLFGSVARGEADRRSDIDCFVLVRTDRATNQRRAHEISQKLVEQRFDGERYKFQVLVESHESAKRQADRLREIVADGVTLYETDTLSEVKTEVLA
nr:nucleotidyltransferase domain-containing protein [Natronosalvus rutilus]